MRQTPVEGRLAALLPLLVRLAVVAGLALAATGLRAGSPTRGSTAQWSATKVAVLSACAAASLGLVALVTRGDDSGRPRKLLSAAGAVLGLVLVVLLRGSAHGTTSPEQRARVVRPPSVQASPRPVPLPAVQQAAHPTSHHLLLVVLTVVAVVSLLAAFVSGARSGLRGTTEPEELVEPATALAAGVEAASRALSARPEEPARDRVLAAYAAFEGALASRTGRRASDTPTAALERAVADGADPAPARNLTDLFSRARYSLEPVTAEDVAAAERALRSLLVTA